VTRHFNVYYTCGHCNKQSTAETGFGRWMRAQPALDSRKTIVRTDTDHTILRYMTSGQGRDFQLMMDIEVKEMGSRPSEVQRDIQNIKHQLMISVGQNRHGARTFNTRKVKSILSNKYVMVRYLGYHLLVFEQTSPADSDWILWDKTIVNEEQLIQLLALEVDPWCPSRSMQELLRDRHSSEKHPFIPGIS